MKKVFRNLLFTALVVALLPGSIFAQVLTGYMTAYNAPEPYVVTSSATISGHRQFVAFDNDLNTYCQFDCSSTPVLLLYNHGSQCILKSVTIKNWATTYYATAFTVYGSNDGSNYTALGSYTINAGETKSVTVSNTNPYLYTEIVFTGYNSSTYLNIYEVQLFGDWYIPSNNGSGTGGQIVDGQLIYTENSTALQEYVLPDGTEVTLRKRDFQFQMGMVGILMGALMVWAIFKAVL